MARELLAVELDELADPGAVEPIEADGALCVEATTTAELAGVTGDPAARVVGIVSGETIVAMAVTAATTDRQNERCARASALHRSSPCVCKPFDSNPVW